MIENVIMVVSNPARCQSHRRPEEVEEDEMKPVKSDKCSGTWFYETSHAFSSLFKLFFSSLIENEIGMKASKN